MIHTHRVKPACFIDDQVGPAVLIQVGGKRVIVVNSIAGADEVEGGVGLVTECPVAIVDQQLYQGVIGVRYQDGHIGPPIAIEIRDCEIESFPIVPSPLERHGSFCRVDEVSVTVVHQQPIPVLGTTLAATQQQIRSAVAVHVDKPARQERNRFLRLEGWRHAIVGPGKMARTVV